MDKISVIRLGCVGCGAALEIGQDVNQLACGHCGTSQVVQREGGAIHLKELAHTLSRVQAGTDKTAAELAIARLTREQEQLVENRRTYEEQMAHRRNSRLRFWSELIATRQQHLVVSVLIGLIAGVIIGIPVSTRLFGGGNYNDIGLLLTVIAALAGVFIADRVYRRITHYNHKDLVSARDQEILAIDAEVTSSRTEFDRQMRDYSERIRKNSEVANT